MRRRLDAELVRRGLAPSKEQAVALIESGRVRVDGTVAAKPATQVERSAPVLVTDESDDPGYVSRGGFKLAGALATFRPRGLKVAGRRALDAGASTGGFTDVLLREDAREVLAVDVAYGDLHWRLRTDDRVTVHERTNVRELGLDVVGDPVDLVVADLSFISLATVLPVLRRCASADADLVLMVKPQFELPRESVDGGVVRDPAARADAVERVVTAGAALGLGLRGVVASPLPGPAGNVEYFVWLHAGAPPGRRAMIERAVEEGPP